MTHSNINNDISTDLATSLRVTTALIKEVVSEIRDNATVVAVMREKINSITDSVNTLSHIVRDGNGKGSIVTRMALVEKAVASLEGLIDDFKKHVDKDMTSKEDEITREKNHKRERVIEKIKFWGAVTPGILSSVALILKALGVF